MLSSSLFINLQAQNFEWAKREGFSAYDYGYGTGTDNAGNVYVAGKYEGTADFSGVTLPCAGNHDIYLAKYTSAGVLTWIRTGGGLLGDYAHAMACDKTTSVYVAGEIEGAKGSIINFPGSAITLTTVGDNDIFVSKYDLNGTLIWAKSDGGYYSEKAEGVSYDAAGNVYVCGFFTDTTIFGGVIIPGAGYRDAFIAKYDVNGNFQWMKHAGGPGRDEASSIKTDAAGNSYICGMMSDNAVFGTTTLNTTGTYGNLDAFIAKYAPDGTLLWVKKAGGDYDDVAFSLTMDNAGKIFVTGEFNGYALFGAIALTTSSILSDGFVVCYDAAGTPQWASQIAGTLVDRPRGIGCDGSNLFITGQFGGTSTFGSSTLTAVDSSDIFIAGLDNNGVFLWSRSVTGPADQYENLGYESGIAVCADPSGAVYATGALLDGGTFGTFSFTPYSRTDMFVTKINTAAATNGVNAINSINNKLQVSPNPNTGAMTVNLLEFANQKIEIIIYDCLGQIIERRTDQSPSKINFDLSAHKKGMYFIEVEADQKIYRNKIILQ